MDVIRISAIALAPLMVYMALGFFLKKRNYLSPSATKQLNIVCFRFFLSVMCGETIYKANLKEDVELLPVLVVAIGIVAVFGISWIIVPRFVKDKTQIPVMIQGIYKCNYAILGIPIAQSIYGGNVGIASVIAVILVPLNNTLSALIFERYTGASSSPLKICYKVLTNPLVVGSLAGLLLNITGIVIPGWIMTSIVAKISGLATPLSMIALGASFEFGFIRKYRIHLTWAVLGRLVFVPMLVLPISIALGLRGMNLVSVMIFATSPNAVNSYSTAVAMGGDADLANEIVVMSSIFSMLTMFLWFVGVGMLVGF
jgi:hypothetical protein